jgi:hypothetical protein
MQTPVSQSVSWIVNCERFRSSASLSLMVIAGSTDCNEQRRLAQTEIWNPSTGKFRCDERS